MYHRYRGARRPEKQRILDEFCQVTGQHRKHAIRLLNSPAPGAAHPPRPRAAQYPPAVIDALRKIWEAAGYPWSVRLKALLPLWLPWARRRLHLRAAVEAQLLRISPRQIDRRLAPHRREIRTRLYGRTKPGSLLKHHIPLKTDRWDVATPGFTEIDLVAHYTSRRWRRPHGGGRWRTLDGDSYRRRVAEARMTPERPPPVAGPKLHVFSGPPTAMTRRRPPQTARPSS